MEIIKKKIRPKLRQENYPLPYNNRDQRAKFIASRYKNFIKDSILDVGSGENYLKKYIPNNVRYISVDIEGNPDYIINLEKEKLNVFEDLSFYTIVCTEVLEHLDNIHDVFNDICRVSKKYIIISLQNSWAQFKFDILKGTNHYKFYGLPVMKPADRHKWFFNYEEAYNFLKMRGKLNNFIIIDELPLPLVKNTIKHQILNIFFKNYYKIKYNYKNLFYYHIWILLKRSN